MAKIKPVPYRFITGLSAVQQREIERDFASLTADNPAGPWLFIAAHDATAYEKSIADLVCDGVADTTLIRAFFAELDGGWVMLSTGTFLIQGTLDCTKLTALVGSGGIDTAHSTVLDFQSAGSYFYDDAHSAFLMGMSATGHNQYVADIEIVYEGALNVTVFAPYIDTPFS